MKVRDIHKDKNYFIAWRNEAQELINDTSISLKNGEVPDDRISTVNYLYTRDHIDKLIAGYSLGLSKDELRAELSHVINLMHQHWYPDQTKVKKRIKNKRVLLDQYMFEPYEYFLKVLSLAYLLQVEDDSFCKLVDILDRDSISDCLYECIIKDRQPDRVQEKEEGYNPNLSVVLKVYKRLREACQVEDKVLAAELVKAFLEKDFYHRHMVRYNSHKEQYNLYIGYWSFEAAAVVRIRGLDDSSFRDHPYYPSDLV